MVRRHSAFNIQEDSGREFETDRQRNRQRNRQTDRQADRQTGKQTDRQTGKQTDRGRDRHICSHTNANKGMCTVTINDRYTVSGIETER
jgi:hypothetical protein